MKTTTSLAVALGATTAIAGALAPRATLPKVTVKGNGMLGATFFLFMPVLIRNKHSSLARSVSTFEALTTSPVERQMLLIPSPTSPSAGEISLSEHLHHPLPWISLIQASRFKKLKINTVRIYTIDNSKDHTECMKELADAGIYLALDINTPKYSIRRDKPGQSYNSVYLQNVFATIDEFQKYDNTLLFFSGNELINNVPTSIAAPYVKAVTRDMKQYMGNRGYRAIPVGYSAADIGLLNFTCMTRVVH